MQVLPHPPVLRAVQTVVDKVKEAGHMVTPWEPYKHSDAVDMIGKIYTADGGTVGSLLNNGMVKYSASADLHSGRVRSDEAVGRASHPQHRGPARPVQYQSQCQ